ncbi:MAG: nickel pincer cofactor biosynthesis protein LarC [Acidobacteriota bacterium]|jgi:hypothetical protein
MRRVLYLDPFGGAAGDMLLAALLDAGAAEDEVRRTLGGLGLTGWRLEIRRDRQQGFAGTRVVVEMDEIRHPARHFGDVQALLTAATLPERARRRALAVFEALFRAEATVHGQEMERVHLHEAGAVDAVIDIVGTCAALESLQVEKVVCGPVPVGRGTVATAHGLLPVPPPAVAELLRGMPLAAHAADGEMTTPTGAALLVTLVDSWSPPPSGVLLRVGVGLGTRVFTGVPNMLRALVLEQPGESGRERPVEMMSATLDDITGERVAWLLERLREVGALDAWCLPGTGRKGRPIQEIRALCEPEQVTAVVGLLFAEGATLGARLVTCRRPEIARHLVNVETEFGPIPVKIAVHGGLIVSAKPEHDACREAARQAGVSLARVEEAARRAAPHPGQSWPTGPMP